MDYESFNKYLSWRINKRSKNYLLGFNNYLDNKEEKKEKMKKLFITIVVIFCLALPMIVMLKTELCVMGSEKYKLEGYC